MNYQQSYNKFLFDISKKSSLRTYKYYTIPANLAYLICDYVQFSNADYLMSLVTRVMLLLHSVHTIYLLNKAEKLRSIVSTIDLSIIIFSCSVNFLIWLSHLKPIYSVGISYVAIGGISLIPMVQKKFWIVIAFIYAPSFYLTYAHLIKDGTNVTDGVIYYIFSLCLIFIIYAKNQDSKAALDEEFRSKWLLASQLNSLTSASDGANSKQQNQKTNSVARQVIHDLRSPLTALGALTKTSSSLSSTHSEMLNLVIKRIEGVTKDLSQIYNQSPDKFETFLLNDAIEKIIIEKTVMNTSNIKLNIEKSIIATSNIEAIGIESYFLRILSNIINNSIDAASRSCNIMIQTSLHNDHITVSIKDDGPGLPEESAKLVGTEGFSYGKENGMGIGLFDAKNRLKEWGGNFEFSSQPGKGAEVTLSLLKKT